MKDAHIGKDCGNVITNRAVINYSPDSEIIDYTYLSAEEFGNTITLRIRDQTVKIDFKKKEYLGSLGSVWSKK